MCQPESYVRPWYNYGERREFPHVELTSCHSKDINGRKEGGLHVAFGCLLT